MPSRRKRTPAPPKPKPDVSWMLRAACRNVGPDLFHNDDRKALGAKAFCGDCAVKAECLDYAITQHIHEGVWGGMTGTERQSYRRRIARRKALNVVQMGD